jgi:hypothetical protein
LIAYAKTVFRLRGNYLRHPPTTIDHRPGHFVCPQFAADAPMLCVF